MPRLWPRRCAALDKRFDVGIIRSAHRVNNAPVIAAKQESTLLASIQTLRALAAWLVVGHHYCSTFSVAKPNWVQAAFINHGAKGVDIFFVISGLVMGLSASAPDITPRVFAAKRLARIVPAYWFYTVLIALMITQAPTIMVGWSYSHELLVRSLFFLQPGIGRYPILTVGWTLNFEMVFYVIVAAALFARGPRRWLWITCGVVVLQLLLVPLGLVHPGYSDSLLYEFLMGIVAAHLWRAGALRGPSWLFAGLAILAIVCLALPHADSHAPVRGLEWGAPAFLLVCAFLGLEPYFKRATLFVHLGDHSYSVYLIHTTILSVASYIHRAHRGHIVLISACSFAAIALLGAASYRFLERPAARLMLRLLLPRRPPHRAQSAVAADTTA